MKSLNKSQYFFTLEVDANGKGLLYSGVTDCFKKILQTEGFQGMYKGVVANYMRLAPHSLFCLLFWDILKDLKREYIDERQSLP